LAIWAADVCSRAARQLICIEPTCLRLRHISKTDPQCGTVQFCFHSGRLTCSARTGFRAVTTPLVWRAVCTALGVLQTGLDGWTPVPVLSPLHQISQAMHYWSVYQLHIISQIAQICGIVKTSCFGIGSDSPHRRGMTPLLRAIGCVRRPRRLDASIVQGVPGRPTCPVSRWGIRPPIQYMVRCAHVSLPPPNGISIASSFFAGLTVRKHRLQTTLSRLEQ